MFSVRRVLGKPSTSWTLNNFCGVIHLLRSKFFVDFTCKQQGILVPGKTNSALIQVVEGDFCKIPGEPIMEELSKDGNSTKHRS